MRLHLARVAGGDTRAREHAARVRARDGGWTPFGKWCAARHRPTTTSTDDAARRRAPPRGTTLAAPGEAGRHLVAGRDTPVP